MLQDKDNYALLEVYKQFHWDQCDHFNVNATHPLQLSPELMCVTYSPKMCVNLRSSRKHNPDWGKDRVSIMTGSAAERNYENCSVSMFKQYMVHPLRLCQVHILVFASMFLQFGYLLKRNFTEQEFVLNFTLDLLGKYRYVQRQITAFH